VANETSRDQQALFAVPMTCEGCVKDVSDALYKISGISKVEANLKDQLVRVEGTGMGLTGRSVSFCCTRSAVAQ
jgi:copper chaperone CopZ